jgi:hypothetical protein
MPIDPGNTLKTAKNISISKPKVFRDFVSKEDRVDLYRFKLSRSRNFNLTLTNLRANIDVRLLNQRGKTLIQSRRSGKQSERISATLNSGTYYVQVTSRNRKRLSYRLALSALNTTSTPNTAPTLSIASELEVIQDNVTPISNVFLKATDQEQSSTKLVYTLTNSPRSGKLLLNGIELGIGSTFTQDDIDNARLTYAQQRKITQLTNNNVNDQASGIDGFNVAWTNFGQNTDSEIFFFNGSTRVTSPLTNNESNETATGISNTNVVWTDTGTVRAFFYNGTTKSTVQVTGNIDVGGIAGTRFDTTSGISGDNILLSSIDEIPTDPVAISTLVGLLQSGININNLDDVARLLDSEVLLYNTTTGTITRLTNNSTGDIAGGVSGSNAVWSGFDGTDFEVFFYEGTTGKTTQLTNNNTDDLLPRISGSNVVWSGFDGTDNEVFFYNSATGGTVPLTNNTTNDEVGGISGSNVVWTGFDGNDNEVFFYNGATGATTALTDNTTNDLAGGISGSNIVWTGFDGTDDEVFVSGFTPTDSLSFTVTDGSGGSTNGTLNITIS